MLTKKELIKRLEDIYEEVRPEISRINENGGQTIFNPVATEMLDDIEDIIFALKLDKSIKK